MDYKEVTETLLDSYRHEIQERVRTETTLSNIRAALLAAQDRIKDLEKEIYSMEMEMNRREKETQDAIVS